MNLHKKLILDEHSVKEINLFKETITAAGFGSPNIVLIRTNAVDCENQKPSPKFKFGINTVFGMLQVGWKWRRRALVIDWREINPEKTNIFSLFEEKNMPENIYTYTYKGRNRILALDFNTLQEYLAMIFIHLQQASDWEIQQKIEAYTAARSA